MKQHTQTPFGLDPSSIFFLSLPFIRFKKEEVRGVSCLFPPSTALSVSRVSWTVVTSSCF